MNMHDYQLADNLYISLTPAGAYHAVASNGEEPYRKLLKSILRYRSTPTLTLEGLTEWTGKEDANEALDLLYHAQALGWVEGLQAPRMVPEGSLEGVIPGLLPALSGSQKVLLADNQGFYVSSSGFNHETAEELSALSADIASLHDRHIGLLRQNLGLGTAAWALIDSAGNTQIGFWPLFIGEQRFVLIVGGVPYLNKPELVSLIWSLSIRYDN